MLKEPSTWAGIAALIIAGFGLDTLSAEQIATIFAGVAGIFLPETK